MLKLNVFLVCTLFAFLGETDAIISGTLCFIPTHVAKTKIYFTLYNKQHVKGTLIRNNDYSKMNKDSKTIFIVQGWLEESIVVSRWPVKMISAYLNLYPDADVLLMDWTRYSLIRFLTATCSAPIVGKYLGEFIIDLAQNGFDLKDIEIVGFSLGGQVAGHAGSEVKKNMGDKVGLIIGLDVEGRGYDINGDDERLSSDDADEVIGIHTNTDIGTTKKQIGRVDFYINGGKRQPSCNKIHLNPIMLIICSHWKAPALWTAILQGEIFVGWHCTDLSFKSCDKNQTAIISENIDPNAKGIYFVKTHF